MVYCTYGEKFFLNAKRTTVRHPADIMTIVRSSLNLPRRFWRSSASVSKFKPTTKNESWKDDKTSKTNVRIILKCIVLGVQGFWFQSEVKLLDCVRIRSLSLLNPFHVSWNMVPSLKCLRSLDIEISTKWKNSLAPRILLTAYVTWNVLRYLHAGALEFLVAWFSDGTRSLTLILLVTRDRLRIRLVSMRL